MRLIGMFDSPFVRRVATTLHELGLPFAHDNWSVGRDFDRIRAFSPLGRVPVLVLDDGTPLVESSAILDTIDELVGPERALLPQRGIERRDALQLMANAVGGVEKGRDLLLEGLVRPREKYHEPWVARLREQMHGALDLVEAACSRRGPGAWLVGDRMTQADVTVVSVTTYLDDTLEILRGDRYPSLRALTARCEQRPAFQATRLRWIAPAMQSPA